MTLLLCKVAGGACYGAWPGLKAKELDEGVDLAVATDYRQVVSEVLAAYGGASPPKDVFPGYVAKGALGLFRAAHAQLLRRD